MLRYNEQISTHLNVYYKKVLITVMVSIEASSLGETVCN